MSKDTPKIIKPTTANQVIQDLLYRIERLEKALQIKPLKLEKNNTLDYLRAQNKIKE